MRTISAALAAILSSGNLGQSVRVSVKDSGGTFRDLTTYPGLNMVDKVSWQDGNDSPGATASVMLEREVDKLSLAPLVESSPLNLGFDPAASYAPLLQPGRELKIEVSTDPMDAAPANWMTVFHGYVDKVDPGQGAQVQIECRDLGARVMDTFIETERVYAIGTESGDPVGCRVWAPQMELALNEFVIPTDGKRKDAMYFYEVTSIGSAPHITFTKEPVWPTGVASTVVNGNITFTRRSAIDPTVGYPVEDVMQQILDDNGLSSITLSVSSTPNPIDWDIRSFIQSREPVLEALRKLAIQIGWDVRYKWDSGSSSFKLTLFEPDRATTTSLQTFTHSQIDQVSGLALDIADIRNVVRLYYPDTANLWPDGSPSRQKVEVSDSASITTYGRRWMEIQEDFASNIDTSTEATAMATACLNDLKDPTVEVEATLVYGFPWVELGDLYTFQAQTDPDTNRYFTSDQDLAVVGWSCEAMDGHIRTSLRCRGKPSIGKRRWFKQEVRPAFGRHPHRENVFTDSGGVTVAANDDVVVGGTIITVARDPTIEGIAVEYEYHVDETADFDPSDSTLKGVSQGTHLTLSDLVPGQTYYAAVVPRYRNGSKLLRTEKSAEVQFQAGRGKAGHLRADVQWGKLPLNGSFETQFDPSKPPDHWRMLSGTWGDYFSIQSGAGVQGGQFLRMIENDQSFELATDVFPVREGHRHRFGFHMLNDNGDTDEHAILTVHFLDESQAAISTAEVIGYAVDASAWTKFEDTVESPSGARFAYLSLTKDVDVFGDGVWGADFDSFFWEDMGEAWIAPSLGNSWVNYDSSTYQAAAYRKDATGRVYLKGLIKDGTVGNGTPPFTLPAGYRPPKNANFAVVANDAFGRVEVQSDGDVTVLVGSNAFVSLDGISFDTWE